MPSTYTHYRFGKDVKKTLPKSTKKLIEKNKDLFLIGLHGPDILFYYNPLVPNDINAIGYHLHELVAKKFFTNGKKIIEKHKEDRDKYIAYMLGYICHFALDSECHSYIEYRIIHDNLTHTEIETDFERRWLKKDKFNPVKYNTASHIVCTKEVSEVIAEFYDKVSKKDIRKALKGMKLYNKLLLPTNEVKKELIENILTATGNYEEMHGLIMQKHINGRCINSTRDLMRKYQDAIPVATKLINNYMEFVQDNKTLDSRYSRTFGPDEAEMAIYTLEGENV